MKLESIAVGREDGNGEIKQFHTVKEAEEYITEIAKTDPEGVERGDYYIDVPESMQ